MRCSIMCDGTKNDGTKNDGTKNDGTKNDGTKNDGTIYYEIQYKEYIYVYM